LSGACDLTAVSRAEIVSEVADVFARYEAALVANDAEAIVEHFWASELVTRFGVGDHQFGAREVAAWRREQPPLPAGRTLEETRIVTFGDCVGVVTTLFRYPGEGFLGRQTQTWMRLAEGWRIVTAHVSYA
jgi:ketosteroid isomerase-like protein